MNRIKRIWILGLLLIGASCNSWLDVAPEDQIMEKDLFEEREGFLMALNGVYLNMNSSSNYGGNLSVGIIDVMAQYYNCTTSEHNYSGYQSYAYDSKTSKDRFETVWKTTYSQISNLNAILEHCGDGNPVLPELYTSHWGQCAADPEPQQHRPDQNPGTQPHTPPFPVHSMPPFTIFKM